MTKIFTNSISRWIWGILEINTAFPSDSTLLKGLKWPKSYGTTYNKVKSQISIKISYLSIFHHSHGAHLPTGYVNYYFILQAAGNSSRNWLISCWARPNLAWVVITPCVYLSEKDCHQRRGYNMQF